MAAHGDSGRAAQRSAEGSPPRRGHGQIFSRNPRGWKAEPWAPEEVEQFSACAPRRASSRRHPSNYLINLAAADRVRESQCLVARRLARLPRADYLVSTRQRPRACERSHRPAPRPKPREGSNSVLQIFWRTRLAGCDRHRSSTCARSRALPRPQPRLLHRHRARLPAATTAATKTASRPRSTRSTRIQVRTSRAALVQTTRRPTTTRGYRHWSRALATRAEALAPSPRTRPRHAAFLLETPSDETCDDACNLEALRSFVKRPDTQETA